MKNGKLSGPNSTLIIYSSFLIFYHSGCQFYWKLKIPLIASKDCKNDWDKEKRFIPDVHRYVNTQVDMVNTCTYIISGLGRNKVTRHPPFLGKLLMFIHFYCPHVFKVNWNGNFCIQFQFVILNTTGIQNFKSLFIEKWISKCLKNNYTQNCLMPIYTVL